MTFHEGQYVKVKAIISSCGNSDVEYWRQAKTIKPSDPRSWIIEFLADGKRKVVLDDPEWIRELETVEKECPVCGAKAWTPHHHACALNQASSEC